MDSLKDWFQRVSYLQYPFVVVSLYYYALFAMGMVERELLWGQLNNALVFYGIGLSFSTLQDTTKTQNTLSRKVWESPRKGKLMLGMLVLAIVVLMSVGLFGLFQVSESAQKEVSFGLVVLSTSLLGMLKAAAEMFENHRKDKNKP